VDIDPKKPEPLDDPASRVRVVSMDDPWPSPASQAATEPEDQDLVREIAERDRVRAVLDVEAMHLATKGYGNLLDFVAKLASIEDLDALSPFELLVLRHAAGALIGFPGIALRHDQLVQGHAEVRWWIPALLAGEKYEPGEIQVTEWPVFELQGWRVKNTPKISGASIDIRIAFGRVLLQVSERRRPFPFGYCANPKCPQPIFVRHRRSRDYCTPTCKYNAEHDERKTTGREDYNQYMQKLQELHRQGTWKRGRLKKRGAKGKRRLSKRPRKGS
jgi:hypothetical protein